VEGKVSKPFQRSPRYGLWRFKETLDGFIIADPYTEKEHAAG
jgi:lipid II:glycine glycyltransferase (peptidoglycan interpeptide bridge formation enzyme)